MAAKQTSNAVATFCPLCVSRCGASAHTEDGALRSLRPDPSHPTGRALCIKGKAAPDLVAHRQRLTHPLKRTAAKGAADPGWQPISWDEALDVTAAHLRRLADQHGPESVVFGSCSPSTSAIVDAMDWIMRLRRAFGSPNQGFYMELCGWGRYLASLYTYGASVPGEYMPDLERAGCILYWGYNPSVTRLAHATSTSEALSRGARLVVVDPRRAGLASRADHWLQVRPGTDAALALALMHVMIERGWFDEDFVRRWTNASLLVRSDDGRLLRESDLLPDGDGSRYVAWDTVRDAAVTDDPARADGIDPSRLALRGTFEIATADGPVRCAPVFELLAQQCAAMPPQVAAAVTGIAATDIEATARTLCEHRPLAFYAWSGLEQHGNATQTARAVHVLYALTGCFDAPGGNVLFDKVPTNPVDGMDLLDGAQRGKALGVAERPLGPAKFEFITGEDFYAAALDNAAPRRARGLVNFGANLTMAYGDSVRGRDALAALDFFVHADLFMNPTAEQADIVLPVTSAFESEGLKVGFEISQQAQSLVQLRKPVVAPRGEARSDVQIVFDLAVRLGLGEHFFDGDVDAGLRHQLEPSGVTLEQLRAEPAGVRVPLSTRHHKYAVLDDDGAPIGFRTRTRKVELYSEVLHESGYAPLPSFEEPAVSPRSRPDLAKRFPLVLTCAKSLHFCETQHRNLPSLRRGAADPQVELHPDTAASRGIRAGDWVRIETPDGSVRARAKLISTIAANVVCGQHGWWQGCDELDLPAQPPFSDEGANLNLVLRLQPSDPISGSSPLRAWLCDVQPDTG